MTGKPQLCPEANAHPDFSGLEVHNRAHYALNPDCGEEEGEGRTYQVPFHIVHKTLLDTVVVGKPVCLWNTATTGEFSS